jgi:hypothetical protein
MEERRIFSEIDLCKVAGENAPAAKSSPDFTIGRMEGFKAEDNDQVIENV